MKCVNTTALVRKPKCSIDAVALFDTLLIALMLTYTGSRFVLAPGVAVDLESLPEVKNITSSVPDADASVLNANGKNMIIYDAHIYTIDSFKKRMSGAGKVKEGSVLLVKAQKNVDAQTLVDIFKAARDGGFKQVQLAAQNR